jgi:DNA-directed RNA polymerase specialized sigma24 family protein
MVLVLPISLYVAQILSFHTGSSGSGHLWITQTVRNEWISRYRRYSVEKVQGFAVQWAGPYNHDHPDMALGGFTPKQHLDMAT